MKGTMMVETDAMRRIPPEITRNSSTAITIPEMIGATPRLFSNAMEILLALGPVTIKGTPIVANRAKMTAITLPRDFHLMPLAM